MKEILKGSLKSKSKKTRCTMEDKAYLEFSEISFFIKNLFTQVAMLRPEDSVEFAFAYFRKVRSCHNVLGADYGFISGCNKNRRGFVFCLMELFKTFSDDEEMNVNECQQIIEMVCPNFPTSIMPAVVSSLEVKNANVSPPKYRHGDIRVSLYFHIIYDEWLKYIMTIFKDEGSLDCLSMFRVRAYIEDCRKNKRISFCQPSEECIEAALSQITSQDVSFIMLKKALFESKIIELDVTMVPEHTTDLLTESSSPNNAAALPKKEVSSQSIEASPPVPPLSSPAPVAPTRGGSRISAASLMNDGTSNTTQRKTENKKKSKPAANIASSSDDDDSDDEGSQNSSL